MKKIITLVSSLMLVLSIELSAQTYTIEKWLGGKASATVLTFDDWSPGQGPIAMPRLKERQLTGTFFVTTANSFSGGGYPQMNQGAIDGFEIGNHTINHPELATVDATTLVNETTGAKTILTANVPAAKIETFCYPRGSYNQAVINQVKTNHIAAREFDDKRDYVFKYDFAQTEDDYYRIKQIQVNNERMNTTEMAYWMDHAIANNGLMIYTFHSIGPNDTWFDQISESFLVSLLDVVASKKSQSWITTFSNAVKYHKEARTAILTNVSNTASTWTLNLTDGYSDNATYNHPLSIKLDYNIAETIVSITQNGVNVPFTLANGKIAFNAIPDGGNIVINKSATGVVVNLNITAPTNNAVFTGLNPITLSANATATNGTISNVKFVVNGTQVIDNASPYSTTWTPTAYGTYTLQTTATAVTGETQISSVNFTVSAPNTAPTVSITSPANNSTFTAPASIVFEANASDSDGSISKVEFFNGATSLGLGTLSTGKYKYTWSGVAEGSYSITAKATDNNNAVTTSSAIAVTVNPAAGGGCSGVASYCVYPCIYNLGDFVQYNGVKYQAQSGGLYNVTPGTAEHYWKTIGACGASNPSPVVSLTSPANNSSVNQPATITISANASDDVSISKVEFYNGTTLLNTDVTAPYSYSWTGVTAGTYAIKAIAYDNLNASTSSSVANVTVINPAPTVALTSPTNNQVFATTPATITIAANATDDGSITKVEFYNGTTLLNSDATAPYSYSWTGVATGNYTITAKAYDNQNAVTTSSAVTIQVGNQAPTVTLTSPTNGYSANQIATISIAATASDADGTISKVEFYNGTTLLNSVTTAPYTYSWTGVVAGTYAIKAIAYDNLNATTTSSIANITVNNQAPSVTLNTPTNNQSFNPAPASVSITATAADADGTISKVEFYNGATLLNSDVTAPFAYTWSGVAAGSYAITAKAYDNQNKVTTSSVANITVVGAGGTCTAPVYNASTAYNGGQSVQYNGIKYTANWWTQGAQPDLNNGAVGTGKPWTSNGTCTSRVGDNVVVASASSIYPNPTTGSFTIETETETSAVILNAIGKEVATLSLVKGQNEVNLSLVSGVYFVKINNNVTKLVIE